MRGRGPNLCRPQTLDGGQRNDEVADGAGADDQPAAHFAVAPLTQSARVFHSRSSRDVQNFPPVWKASPPASSARGCVNRRLLSGSPGAISLSAFSKLRLDCASVHLPESGNGSRWNSALLLSREWQS